MFFPQGNLSAVFRAYLSCNFGSQVTGFPVEILGVSSAGVECPGRLVFPEGKDTECIFLA